MDRQALGTAQIIRANSRDLPLRVAYELTFEAIPDRHVIDHLCRVRACCRPDHLEAVTNGENLRRGDLSKNNGNLAKTSCPSGHPYDERNT